MQTPGLLAAADILTEDERACFKRFSQLCCQEKLLERPASLQHGDLIDGLTDQHTLLRFLRGKSFNVDRAYEQFRDALAIRQSVGAIATYETIDIDDFEETRKLYPHWSGYRDKSGKPICIFDSRNLDHDTIQKYNQGRNVFACGGDTAMSSVMAQAIVFHDYLTRFVFPVCSAMRNGKQTNTAISSAVYIADVSGMTLKQAWNLRMYIQDLSMLLSISFPEVIDRIYAINAPSYFGAIWSFVSKLIDPRTASKVEIILPAQVPATLASIIDVDHLPAQYGGRLDIQYGTPPRVDEAMLKSLANSCLNPIGHWPGGPIKLSMNKQGQVALVAVGTEGGHRRQDVIGFIR